ncbi:MAG TPA: amidohydrolase family protein [Steroidobacteraceae bacterium]|nr:amidohydrolase family protein [Steroidobacteraceae bacterium]
MLVHRRNFLRKCGGAGLVLAASGHIEFAAAKTRRPIIDVHMHSYPVDSEMPKPLVNPITGKTLAISNGAEHFTACVAEMKRHNVIKGIVSGGNGDRLQAAIQWHDNDPARFIAGASIRGSEDTPLPDLAVLRKGFSEGKFRVLGEVTAQYAGATLSDPRYDPYLSLAEEFDIPVALHTGSMPPGMTQDPCCRTARAHFGNPGLVEDALSKHPKLRLNLMHCGYPYLEDTIAILMQYPQVNADLGAIDWLLPREAFHSYLHALTSAGFGKRLMFGSDHMFWPDAIGLAIEAVESASFLSEDDKNDIFCGNALRFYKLQA